MLRHRDDRDGGGRHDETLELVEMRARVVRQRDANGIRVGHDDDPLAGVLVDDGVEGADRSRVDLGEGLTARETEPRWVSLHRRPLVELREVFEALTGPFPEVALDDAGERTNGQPGSIGDRGRRLLSALDGTRVEGVRTEWLDAGSKVGRLPLPGLRQWDAGGTPGEDGAGVDRHGVPREQQHGRPRRVWICTCVRITHAGDGTEGAPRLGSAEAAAAGQGA